MDQPARIDQWPPGERPRERLLERGAHALSDAELLAVVIGTGSGGVNALDIGISATVVNALTPAACGRCVRIHNREQRIVGTLRRDLRRLVTPRCAIIGAPIVVPPPRGAEALRQWQRAWTTLDA